MKVIGILLFTIFAVGPKVLKAQCGPFSNGEVPDATSGFRHPLNAAEVSPGWKFVDRATGYTCGAVWHPGRDINAGSGDTDLGTPVYAVANGKVVYANGSSWGGVVIQHDYRGVTYYSQYGHVKGIRVACGQNVSKGQQIAEIGKIGATSAHLHFEIREADHRNPRVGSDFPCYQSLANVHNWYENPVPFTLTHGSYSSTTAYVWRFNVNAYFEEWDAFNISGASVSNGILFIDPQGADPYVASGPLAASAYTFQYVQLRMASNALDWHGSIYFKTRAENFYSEDKKIDFAVSYCPPNSCGGQAPFYYYNIYTGWHHKWLGLITGIRVDPAISGQSGTNLDTVGFDYIRLSATSVP
jgi:hypothetical protein